MRNQKDMRILAWSTHCMLAMRSHMRLELDTKDMLQLGRDSVHCARVDSAGQAEPCAVQQSSLASRDASSELMRPLQFDWRLLGRPVSSDEMAQSS